MGRKDTAVLVCFVCAVTTTALPQTHEELQKLANMPVGRTPAQIGIPSDLARHLAGKDRRVDRSTAEAAMRQMWLAANGRVRHPSLAVQRELNRLEKMHASQGSSLLEKEDQEKAETTEQDTTEKTPYLLSEGPCPSGYYRIVSTADCVDAAKYLKLEDEVSTTDVKSRPSGCYYMPEEKQLWYHEADQGGEIDGEKRQSICTSTASLSRRETLTEKAAKKGTAASWSFKNSTDPFVPWGDWVAKSYKGGVKKSEKLRNDMVAETQKGAVKAWKQLAKEGVR